MKIKLIAVMTPIKIFFYILTPTNTISNSATGMDLGSKLLDYQRRIRILSEFIVLVTPSMSKVYIAKNLQKIVTNRHHNT